MAPLNFQYRVVSMRCFYKNIESSVQLRDLLPLHPLSVSKIIEISQSASYFCVRSRFSAKHDLTDNCRAFVPQILP